MKKWIALLFLAVSMPLLCQGAIHVQTPFQWMDTLDYQVMADLSISKNSEYGALFCFSDGESFDIPLPGEKKHVRSIWPQMALTEHGVDLVIKSFEKTLNINNEERDTIFMRFYFISYETIRKGGRDWELKRECRYSRFGFELIPISGNKYLGYNWGIMSENKQIYDWIIYEYDAKNRLKELQRGNWLDSEYASYSLDAVTNQFVPKYGNLSHDLNSAIVHTKNYLVLCNMPTSRMLIFSKETGRLARRMKITDAVPPQQDDEYVCAIPITCVQPDLEDDAIIVLARTDVDIAESIGLPKKMDKLLNQDKIEEAREKASQFQAEKQGAQWYRVYLKKAKVERIKSPDVPETWSHDYGRTPYFVPYKYGQILFGGLEKSHRELIESVFKKPAEKTEAIVKKESK